MKENIVKHLFCALNPFLLVYHEECKNSYDPSNFSFLWKQDDTINVEGKTPESIFSPISEILTDP